MEQEGPLFRLAHSTLKGTPGEQSPDILISHMSHPLHFTSVSREVTPLYRHPQSDGDPWGTYGDVA